MKIVIAFAIGVLVGWRAPVARAAYLLARKNGATAGMSYWVAALAAAGFSTVA